MDYLEIATNAARVGADILMGYFASGIEIRNKSDEGGSTYDLVSDADLESERAIADYLRRACPTHELLGEEDLRGDASAEHLWIIDPLDGTNNFAHDIPHFAVSIAYYQGGKPIVGAILNPARNELYTAASGKGAFRNGQPVRVTNSTTLADTLIGCGFYYDRGEMMRKTLDAIEECFQHQIHGIRRFGTAALDLCHVGCGHFGAYFEYQLSPWDFAAGRLFVEEAGGTVSDAHGNSLPMRMTSVVASNGHLHSDIVSITAKHAPA